MERKHGDTDTWAYTSSTGIDLEAVTIFSDLLHFHLDITSNRWRQLKFSAGGGLFTLFAFDLLLEMLHEGALAVGRRVF